MPHIADQNYYLDSTRTKVVTIESPEQAFLLVGKGCEIPDDVAKRFPQILKGEKAKAPAENKAKKPAENK